MKYRPEIDGLRALAVVPVILFHAGFELFSGGFVGVDVFFVISGYLITTILIEDIEKNRFSLINFYERRARRILPALIFVMLICIPFAWMWMMPSQMQNFSESLTAVGSFTSNIFFSKEVSYFAIAAEEKPLLHTWSLAVEEQYYLLFPIFLFLTWRYGEKRVFWIIVLLASISLTLSEWGWQDKPNANFYLAPTRVWELFSGSIVAFIILKRGVKSNNFLSLVGLTLIVFSIFAYDENTPFPGFYALVPVLGVVLLLLYGDKLTHVAKLLSTKGFVGIGLVSYSAYLWHQPLFAFTRIRSVDNPSTNLMLLLVVTSIVLACFSWKFIEMPFRNNTYFKRKHIFTLSVICSVTLILFGLAGNFNGGFTKRINGWDDLKKIPNVESSFCHNAGRRTASQLLDNDFCKIGKGSLGLAIIGDSHAGALFDYANEYLKTKNISALAISGGYCAPIINGFEAGGGCANTIENAFQRILNDDQISNVVLIAEWAIYTQGFRFTDTPRLWGDKQGKSQNISDNVNAFSRSFSATIERLLDANKKIFVIYPVPEFYQHSHDWLGEQTLRGASVDISSAISSLPTISKNDYNKRNDEVFDVFDNHNENVTFLQVYDLFCSEEECKQYNEDMVLLYSDSNHVNYYGAKLIIDTFGSAFIN